MKSIQELLEKSIAMHDDAQTKLDHIDDMHRKGIITHQQKVAIKNGVYRWFFHSVNWSTGDLNA